MEVTCPRSHDSVAQPVGEGISSIRNRNRKRKVHITSDSEDFALRMHKVGIVCSSAVKLRPALNIAGTRVALISK